MIMKQFKLNNLILLKREIFIIKGNNHRYSVCIQTFMS